MYKYIPITLGCQGIPIKLSTHLSTRQLFLFKIVYKNGQSKSDSCILRRSVPVYNCRFDQQPKTTYLIMGGFLRILVKKLERDGWL